MFDAGSDNLDNSECQHLLPALGRVNSGVWAGQHITGGAGRSVEDTGADSHQAGHDLQGWRADQSRALE